jgi:hypothetical protein
MKLTAKSRSLPAGKSSPKKSAENPAISNKTNQTDPEANLRLGFVFALYSPKLIRKRKKGVSIPTSC